MFLCPAAWRKPAPAAAQRETLSDVLAAGTRDVHAASDRLIRSKAPLAFSNKRVWAALLSQFYYIFRALEAALERAAGKHAQLHALHAPFFARLARADAFLADIAFLRCSLSAPLPATLDYTARLGSLAEEQPLLLAVYASTLYVALLSGGRLLEGMLRRTMRLPADRGTSVFRFEELPTREQPRFKQELRDALDALGERVSTEQRNELLQEKRSIFWRNDRVIVAVFETVQGSLLRAWASILRAAVLSTPGLLVCALLVALVAGWRAAGAGT